MIESMSVDRKRYFLKACGLIALIALTAMIYHMSVFRPAKNFHVVEAGKFYRSAQLSGAEFEEAVHEYGIKTVINLRGSQKGEWWFDDEKAVLDRLGVRLENIGWSTEQLQTREDILSYLELLKTVERPILVHCRSGADRTSEASAIYKLDYMHATREEALDQVSLRYLHLPLFQPAKRLFISRYEGQAWAKSIYDPCVPELRPYARRESGCDAAKISAKMSPE